MARRPIEKQLAVALRESSFNFIPIGIVHIENIYELVHQTYHNLCDDDYYCSEHCRRGGNQPEWKHVVRGVLGHLKSNTGSIRKVETRNYWEFL